MSRRWDRRDRLPAILPGFSLSRMGQMFKVKVPEIGFVVHTRLKSVIYRMKLNNCVIYTIESRLIHQIETISVAYTRPWRRQHFISSASYKPIGFDLSGEYLHSFEHR